jgi:hypothetical protein
MGFLLSLFDFMEDLLVLIPQHGDHLAVLVALTLENSL